MAPPQFLSCFEEQLRRTKVTANWSARTNNLPLKSDSITRCSASDLCGVEKYETLSRLFRLRRVAQGVTGKNCAPFECYLAKLILRKRTPSLFRQ
jgi:hypothetical protein